jgi:hypothetical protein
MSTAVYFSLVFCVFVKLLLDCVLMSKTGVSIKIVAVGVASLQAYATLFQQQAVSILPYR